MNSLKFILQKDKADCENYLDDLGGAGVPSLAGDAFDKMGKLLADLKIEELVLKACGPSSSMIFLGIIVDTLKMTLELDDAPLKEIKEMLINWGEKSHASLKEIQSLVGVLSFVATCIKQGRVFFARIINFLRLMPDTGKSKIPDDVRKDINWWKLVAP